MARQTTAFKIIGKGANVHQRARGKGTPKASSSSGRKKKSDKEGNGKEKEKAKESLNVLSIVELPEVNMFSSQ